MVAMDLGSPPLPKKSLPAPGALEQVANRLSSKVAAEVSHGSKQELPDLKGEWPRWQGGGAGQAGHTHRELLGLGVNVGTWVGHSFLLAPQGTKETPAVFFFELLLPWACMALSFTLTGRGRGIQRTSGHGCQGLTLRPSSLADFDLC